MSASIPYASASVWEHLGTDWVGQVHSKFRTSLNVEVEGLLLHIGHNPNRLSGLGMSLPQGEGGLVIEDMAIGDLVRSTSQKVSLFPSRGMPVVYRWSDIQKVASTVAFGSLAPQDLELLETTLGAMRLKSRLGLDLTEEVRERLDTLVQPGAAEVDRRRAIEWLLGRGLGLTPSGDDIVAGYAFVMWASGRDVLDARLRVSARLKTTPVSATMLHMLGFGEVSSAVMAVWNALLAHDESALKDALNGLLDLGHTSGIDTMYGMLLGARTVRAQNHPNAGVGGKVELFHVRGK